MDNSYGRFPINLSRGIMADFGFIELQRDSIIVSNPSINTLQDGYSPTITIELSNITAIRIKAWLLFNTRICVDFIDNGISRTVSFASGDTWSTNIYKTIYLYSVLLDLKNKGKCDTSRLRKVATEDKFAVFLMFVGCFFGILILTLLFGNYGKEFSIIYMLIGSMVFGIPICYFYLVKTRRLVKSIER